MYVRPISSTTPRTPATSTSSPSRSGWVTAISSRRRSCRSSAGSRSRHEADHGRRGEHAAGDRAHLRDHEQRREDADEDDRREDRPAQDAVARGRLGARSRARDPPVDELRARATRARSSPTAISDALPEERHRGPIRPSRSVSGREALLEAVPGSTRLLADAASRARPPRRRAAPGSRAARGRVLHADAELVELARRSAGSLARAAPARLRGVRVARRVAAAVAADRRHELALRVARARACARGRRPAARRAGAPRRGRC